MTLKGYIYICEITENYYHLGVQNIQEYSCKICVKVLTFIWCSFFTLKWLLSPFNEYVNVFFTPANSCFRLYLVTCSHCCVLDTAIWKSVQPSRCVRWFHFQIWIQPIYMYMDSRKVTASPSQCYALKVVNILWFSHSKLLLFCSTPFGRLHHGDAN